MARGISERSQPDAVAGRGAFSDYAGRQESAHVRKLSGADGIGFPPADDGTDATGQRHLCAADFAAFSVLWTALVLPLSAQGLSHTQIGLFGPAGIAGALAASKAGHWADRGQHSALPASLWHYCSLPGPRSPGPKPPCRCWSSESSFWISPCRQSMSLTRA